MNIKDSYVHNGVSVLKDIKIENSVLKKILAGVDSNGNYLDWTTVLDLTTIKPTTAGTADKVGHKLTFSGGVTGDWDGSANKTVAIPTKASWNYDDVYVKLSGSTMTGVLTTPSLTVTGAATFEQAINASILGNAATASRLLTVRTISLSGSVTGSGTFDGSGDLSITTTTNHEHKYIKHDGKALNDCIPDVVDSMQSFRCTSSSTDFSDGYILAWRWSSGLYITQLFADVDANYGLCYRYRSSAGEWANWKRIPMGDGTGASGTWGINITGSAGSVAWGNVSNRPTKLSQFTDDLGSSPTHTHSLYVTTDTEQIITGKKTFAAGNLVQSLDDQLKLDSSYIVCAPQSYYAWHDHFAFLKEHSIQDVQSSTDGTSWVTSSVDVKPLFIEKEVDSVIILRPSDLAFRFTLYSSNMFHSCRIEWFSIGVSYYSTYSATDVLVECSADNSTWTTLHSSNVNASKSTILLKCGRWPTNQNNKQKYVRFTFTKTTNTTTGWVVLNSIKGLTMRKGDQGLGRENEFPFSWDATPNVTFPAGVSATSFTENGTALSSKYLGINANAVSATKATNDSDGNAINTTYLKKSGGTVTGTTTFQSNNFGEAITVKRNDTNSAAIRYSNSNGVIAYLGFTGGDEKALRWWDSNIVSHVIWHDANDGSGSGLDADKLDGLEGSYYATASSLSSYVTLSTTQTISGNKTFSSSISIDDLTAGNLVVTGGASFAQTINGNAATANKLLTARTITIGSKSNSFDGSGNISFTLAQIGALAVGSYKTVQTAVATIGASTNTLTFINSISQDTNGVITATTGVVRDASTSAVGVVNLTTQSFAGAKTFSDNVTVKNLTISNTDAADHIKFSRTTYNYITTPSGGCIVFEPDGVGVAASYGMTMDSTGFRPSTTKGYSLGTSSLYWNNIYGTSIYLNGTALSSAATHAHGDYVTSITYDSTNKKLQQSKGGATATDIVTFGSNAFNSTSYLPLTAGSSNKVTGDLYLSSTSISPALIFERTQEGLYDYKIFSNGSGHLEIQCNKGGSTWTNYATFASDGSFKVGTGIITTTKISNWDSVYTWYTTAAGTSASGVIDNWNEIKNFIDGFHESDDLAEYLVNTFVAKSGSTMTGPLVTPGLTVNGAATFSQAINGSILGNAATASRLLNVRTITVGSTSKSFDGSANISFTLSEIGALAAGSYVTISGTLTISGAKTFSNTVVVGSTSDNKNIEVHGTGIFENKGFGSQLEIWRRKDNSDTVIPYYNGNTKTLLGYIGISSATSTYVAPGKPYWSPDGNTGYLLVYSTHNTEVGGTSTPVYVNSNGLIKAGTALGTMAYASTSNYVTIATEQTISGNKTFSSSVSIDDLIAGNLVVSGSASFTLTINGNIKSANKVNHTLTFSNGNTFNGSADLSVTKSSIGLGNVDNTADANKSVNYATSAGKATNDENGDNIASTYLKKSGGTITNPILGWLSKTPTTTGWYRAAITNSGTLSAIGFVFIKCAYNNVSPETYVFLISCHYHEAEITLISGRKLGNGTMIVSKVRLVTDHYLLYTWKYYFDIYFNYGDGTSNTSFGVSSIGDFEALKLEIIDSVGTNTYGGGERAVAYELNTTRGMIAPKFTGSLSGNATTATTASTANALDWNKLTSSSITKSISSGSWTGTGVSTPTTYGTYVVQVLSGDYYYSGIFSAGITDDSTVEEIPLHSSAPSQTRLYLGTKNKKFYISSAHSSATNVTFTIAYQRLL